MRVSLVAEPQINARTPIGSITAVPVIGSSVAIPVAIGPVVRAIAVTVMPVAVAAPIPIVDLLQSTGARLVKRGSARLRRG